MTPRWWTRTRRTTPKPLRPLTPTMLRKEAASYRRRAQELEQAHQQAEAAKLSDVERLTKERDALQRQHDALLVQQRTLEVSITIACLDLQASVRCNDCQSGQHGWQVRQPHSMMQSACRSPRTSTICAATVSRPMCRPNSMRRPSRQHRQRGARCRWSRPSPTHWSRCRRCRRPPRPVTPQPTTPTSLYPAGLTTHEVEVLRLIAQGLTDAQVAERLVISAHTVMCTCARSTAN
jgi:ATP/maltotriose-dependent transcriptional regulator MalT